MFAQIKALAVKPIRIKIFNLNLSEWMPRRDLLIGLILASITINLLSLVFPLSLLQIYDRIIPNESTATLFYLMAVVITAMIFEMIVKLARSYVSAWGDARLGYKSTNRAFSRLMHAKLNAYEQVGSGVHLDRLNSLNRVKDFYGAQVLTVLLDTPFVLVYLGLIFIISPELVVVPIAMQMIVVAVAFLYSPRIYQSLKNRSRTNQRKLNYIIEVLSGIHTVKSQGMEHVMLRRYERLQNRAAYEDFDYACLSSHQNRIAGFIAQLNLVGIVIIGALLVLGQHITPGAVAACILLSARSMTPFVKALNLWTRFQSIKLSQEKLNAIFQLPQQEMNLSLKHTIEASDIRFQNVSFAYDESNIILKDADLHIQAGEAVSLDAHGAKGKTSILLLIKGLLTPNQGQVFIGGQDIQEYSQICLGKKIAYLPQEGVLFEGTILENMTLFNNVEHSEKAKALSAALELDQFIEQMPQGYQTMLSQGSVDFISKGIKQRILIVRSLVPDPDIILFDEANSAMDISSDMKLKELLKSYHGQKTMIIISHRPSFKSWMDKHYCIQDAQFIEGIHD